MIEIVHEAWKGSVEARVDGREQDDNDLLEIILSCGIWDRKFSWGVFQCISDTYNSSFWYITLHTYEMVKLCTNIPTWCAVTTP